MFPANPISIVDSTIPVDILSFFQEASLALPFDANPKPSKQQRNELIQAIKRSYEEQISEIQAQHSTSISKLKNKYKKELEKERASRQDAIEEALFAQAAAGDGHRARLELDLSMVVMEFEEYKAIMTEKIKLLEEELASLKQVSSVKDSRE